MRTPTRARSIIVMQHLRRKLDEITPTYNVFLVARAAIVQEGECPDLKELLSNENELIKERGILKSQIVTVHGNGNKMEFVTVRARLYVVEKKLQETIKQLNRRLIESEVVNHNFNKLLEEFGWLKQRIDAKEVECLWNQTHDESVLNTTIQKQEQILAQERSLVEQITEMKKETQELEKRERDLEVSKKRVDGITLNLVELQDGNNPHLLCRKRNVAVKKESTKRLYSYEEEMLKKEISNTKDQMEKQENSHHIAIDHLKKRIKISQEELCRNQEENDRKNLRDMDLIINTEIRRECNLKELLQLRVKWQQYEEEQHAIDAEQKCREEAKEKEQRRKEAVKMIQIRLALLYKSKFKKKPMTNDTGKKRKKKKKM